MAVLDIDNLKTSFQTGRGTIKAVDGVTLSVAEGETLGIVGESGCGKSVLALSIMRLVPKPAGKITGGAVRFKGQDLLRLTERQMRSIRGRDISMIFQEPMTALNPVIPIGEQIAESVRLHEGMSRRDAADRAVAMLRLVGMPSPEKRVDDYPHQMSGGMRQRVMIAMALSCGPQLMIADEPTTALDVTIQAQILELIDTLKKKTGTAVIFITHDLGVIAETAQHVGVMYAGKLVECCPVDLLFKKPLHPYTIGLLAALPGEGGVGAERRRLNVIKGTVPNLYDLPVGCSFQERCCFVMDVCRRTEPEYRNVEGDHWVRCWKS